MAALSKATGVFDRQEPLFYLAPTPDEPPLPEPKP